jgi:chromosome segregation ATPase
MPETKEENANFFDPFEPFRGMRDAYLESMSKSMADAVNTESYAEATGAMLDYYLTASAPFREAMEKTMLASLQQLSLPSRQELAALAERFTNLELKVDDIDAKMEILVNSAKSSIQERAQAQERICGLEMKMNHLDARLETLSNSVKPSAEERAQARERINGLEMKMNSLDSKLDLVLNAIKALPIEKQTQTNSGHTSKREANQRTTHR